MAKPRDMNIFFILDGSGSMSSVQNDVVNGVNSFIKSQKKEKKAKTNLWFTVFDTSVYKIYEGEDIQNVKKVTQDVTLKGGATALLDAIGKTLSEAKDAKNTKNRENLVIIYTDGLENSSKEYKKDQIAVLRKKLEKKGNWTFTFMGADHDAFAEAKDYGISLTNTLSTSKSNITSDFLLLADATNKHKCSSASGSAAYFYVDQN